MVDVNRTREAIRLAETFEHRDSGAGSYRHCRERLPHRTVADDRDVSVETCRSPDVTPAAAGTGGVTGRARIWLNAPASSPSGSSTVVGARQAMNRCGRTRIALATIDGAFVASQANATVTLADLLEPLVPAVVAARRSLLAKAR
ncbi:MAG: hypothetical protein ACXVW5_26560 [Solirubrobacteraceae bacterium]